MKEAVHFSIFQGFSWIWIVVTNTLLCFRCSFYNVPMLSFYFKIMCFSFLSFMNLTLVLLTKSIFYRYLLEKAMTPHSSTLAWKIPWTREPGRLQSMGSLGVGHDWAHTHIFCTTSQPTLVLLPGKFHGQRSLVGYSPRGCKELDTTEWLRFTLVAARGCGCPDWTILSAAEEPKLATQGSAGTAPSSVW